MDLVVCQKALNIAMQGQHEKISAKAQAHFHLLSRWWAGMFAFVSMFQVIGVSRRALLCLHVAIDCSNFDSQHDGISIVSPLRWQAQRTAKLDFSSSCFLI
jgi:hypothetical protein